MKKYVTIQRLPQQQLTRPVISLYDVFFGNGLKDINDTEKLNNIQEYGTRTFTYSNIPEKYKNLFNYQIIADKLQDIYQKNKEVINTRERHYREFKIPKRTGRLRTIDAPDDEISSVICDVKDVLEDQGCALFHQSAFAYIPKRSCISAAEKHRRNNSYWFLKLDFSNFFGSITLEWAMEQLSYIFPFSEMLENDTWKRSIENALSAAFLKGTLPIGTPLSPMLTNLLMIPIDYTIERYCQANQYVYTRYADDIVISSRSKFNKDDAIQFIKDTISMFNAPLVLNDKKTKFGNRFGSNYVYGVLINGDNKLSIGYKKKNVFKCMINNFAMFISDPTCGNSNKWNVGDVQHLMGLQSYYSTVDDKFVLDVLKKFNHKYNIDILSEMKRIIREGE